jgi:F-type H+-transporting ATPase subunit delta
VEELARVYAEALFDVAKKEGKLDAIREQLAALADAVGETRDLQVFLFSPYFSSKEKKEGLERAISGAEPEFMNFLELLVEKHRMPVIFRLRRRFDEMWAEENKRLEVAVTSAVELDEGTIRQIGKAIEERTGQKVDLEANVDDRILGGLVVRVGNKVVDASIRHRLEKLRKEVARAT